MSNNYKLTNKQSGGDLLGSGAYGCVFRSNIPCEEGDYTDRDNRLVSKLINNEHKEDEFEKIAELKLADIDTKQRYFVYPIAMCDVPNNIIERDIFKCEMLTESFKEEYNKDFIVSSPSHKRKFKKNISKNFSNIIQPYSGKSFANIRFKNIGGGKMTRRKYECKDFSLVYLDLLKGLLLININNLSHRDIKYPNIVLDNSSGELNARFIDLGLMASINDEDLDKESSEWSSWIGAEYSYWPVDMDIYCSINNGHYSRLKLKIDEIKSKKKKILFILEKADEFCAIYESSEWCLSKIHSGSIYKSCVRFMIDLFIHKKYTEDLTIDIEIQKKWDIFMLGTFLSNELSNQYIEDDDGELDEFFHEFANLILMMTLIHPMERIDIAKCISKYMKILEKYRRELGITKSRLEKEQYKIDQIYKLKKI